MEDGAICISHTRIAGVSRTSPVSFLKAKPKIAIFFPLTVLNMQSMIFFVNQEAKNRPNIDWEDKIHMGVLWGLRNISESP